MATFHFLLVYLAKELILLQGEMVPPVFGDTFPKEAALAQIYDLGRDESLVHHDILAHGSKAAMLADRSDLVRPQRTAQEGTQPLHRVLQVLESEKRMSGLSKG